MPAQPRLVSQMNERSVIRTLQKDGPASRAEMARRLGSTAPTISKAVASLIGCGLLEECDAIENGRGRPAKTVHLARRTAQVLGVAVDADHCRLVRAGLDGNLDGEHEIEFSTPDTYDQLLGRIVAEVERLSDLRNGSATHRRTLGLGISIPGLYDYRSERSILSPNVPMTNGRSPAADLSQRLEMPCAVLQEMHALCLAERHYGEARGMDDFAMLEVGVGVGLGMMSGGRLLTGNSGIAGELGHIPVASDGDPCGCGGRGCLETVASDAALLSAASRTLRRPIELPELVQLGQSGDPHITRVLDQFCEKLAIGIATVINLINPSTLFVHSSLLHAELDLFPRLLEETRLRTLRPSYEDCRIVRARGSKRQGAIAAIIEHLTDSRIESSSELWSSPFHVNGHSHVSLDS